MSLLTDKKYKLASSVKFDEYMKAIGEYQNLYTWKRINKFHFCILEVLCSHFTNYLNFIIC